MLNSIKKLWNGKQLNVEDYENLGNVLIIALAWILITGLI